MALFKKPDAEQIIKLINGLEKEEKEKLFGYFTEFVSEEEETEEAEETNEPDETDESEEKIEEKAENVEETDTETLEPESEEAEEPGTEENIDMAKEENRDNAIQGLADRISALEKAIEDFSELKEKMDEYSKKQADSFGLKGKEIGGLDKDIDSLTADELKNRILGGQK